MITTKLYKCLKDRKIITHIAVKKGVCLGHPLEIHTPEKEKVLKVAISIPTEGHTLPEAYDNHLLFMLRIGGLQERWRYEKRNPRYEFFFYTTGRLLTQMAREKLLKVAIQAEMDYVIMFDDDMILPMDMAERFLEIMEQRPEIDILAALAFMRNPPHYPVMYVVEEGYDSIRKTDYYINKVQKNYPKDRLVECDAVGFGAVIIRMSMVKKMKGDNFFMSTTPTGEDIFFCHKAKREAKARIFMDTRIKLGHLTTPVIADEKYFKDWVKDTKHKIEKIPHKYAIDEWDVDPMLSLDR